MDAERADKGQRLQEARQQALLGGGKDKIDQQHRRGKLAARERLDLLLDPGSFEEQYMLLGHAAGNPSEGVITGFGTVDGRPVCVFAQDATVRNGAVNFMHGLKIYRVTELALRVGVPIVGLYDSPGAVAHRPDEPEEFHHEKGPGGVFLPNTQASGYIPQIAAILGSCAGMAVYSAGLADFIAMVDGISHMFLTGPGIVKSRLGENVDKEELGGAAMHAQVSGQCDFRLDSEQACLQTLRQLLSFLPSNCQDKPPRREPRDDPERLDLALGDLLPADPQQSYDVRQIIYRLVDSADFLEVKPEFAPELVCGFARMDGGTVGLVANQSMTSPGILTCNSARKEARFIRFCDAFGIPIILLVDTTGYQPGLAQERSGTVQHGAKVLYALGEATVAKISVTLRRVYGSGALAMGVEKGLGMDMAFAWPATETGIMGAKEMVELLHADEIKRAAEPDAARRELVSIYEQRYADAIAGASVGRFGIEHVIEPAETRVRLIRALGLLRSKKGLPTYPKKHGNIPL